MRIVSQDGITDLPYEQVAVFVTYRDPEKHCNILARFDQQQFAMGEYPNLQRANKVLESMRTMYQYCCYTTSGYLHGAECSISNVELKNDVFCFPQ